MPEGKEGAPRQGVATGKSIPPGVGMEQPAEKEQKGRRRCWEHARTGVSAPASKPRAGGKVPRQGSIAGAGRRAGELRPPGASVSARVMGEHGGGVVS